MQPTVTKQYKFGTGISWKGNRMSGVALAMRHRHRGLSTYGLNGQRQGDEHPRIRPFGAWHYLPLPNEAVWENF